MDAASPLPASSLSEPRSQKPEEGTTAVAPALGPIGTLATAISLPSPLSLSSTTYIPAFPAPNHPVGVSIGTSPFAMALSTDPSGPPSPPPSIEGKEGGREKREGAEKKQQQQLLLLQPKEEVMDEEEEEEQEEGEQDVEEEEQRRQGAAPSPAIEAA